MATVTRESLNGGAALNPAKAEDNTLDEQHARISERTFPVTDNDQSADSGQSHVSIVPATSASVALRLPLTCVQSVAGSFQAPS